MRILRLIIVLALLFIAYQAGAQVASPSLYIVGASDTEYVVNSYNPITQMATALYTVSTSAQGVLSQLFPLAEIDALNAYLPTYNDTIGIRHPITNLSVLRTDARIEKLAVSPDNQQVVAQIIYQTCFVPQNPVCYGTTQLVLIDSSGHRVLLNLGSHDTQFSDVPYQYPEPETSIWSLEWTPDQQALIIGVIDWRSARNRIDQTLVVVPLNGDSPFKIGEGAAWAIAPEGNRLVAMSYYNADGGQSNNTFYVIDFDLQTRQSSQTSYTFPGYWVDERVGLAFAGDAVVFQRGFDSLRGEAVTSDTGGGLAVFEPQTGEASMLLPETFFTEIQSTPDGSQLILETREGLLVKGNWITDTFELTPLSLQPVADWSLNAQGSVLVQYEEVAAYQIIQPQNPMSEILNLQAIVQLQEQSPAEQSPIIDIDW